MARWQDYINRRARKGCASQKAALLSRAREESLHIDHLVLQYVNREISDITEREIEERRQNLVDVLAQLERITHP